jgi:hypothetical protein
LIRDDTEVLVVCNAITARHLLSNDTTGKLSDALVITPVVEGEEVIVIPKNEFLYYLEHGCSDFEE